MTPAEEWQQQIIRVLARTEAAEKLRAGAGLKEVKEAIRAVQKKGELVKFVENLLLSEVVVEPRHAQVATELGQQLQHEFPQVSNLAVILIGSAVHGGAELRRLQDYDEDTDLDWGILGDYNPSLMVNKPILDSLVQRGYMLIPQIGRKYGLDNLRSCNFYDPYQVNALNLRDSDEVVNLAKKSLNARRLLWYFLPSFPVAVNERNRRIMLAGLRQLAQSDRTQWDQTIQFLLSYWRGDHELKTKHFKGYYNDQRSHTLIFHLTVQSRDIMAESLHQLLLSTGNP